MRNSNIASVLMSIAGLAASAAALFVANHANNLSESIARKSTDPYLIYELVQVPHQKDEDHELEIRLHNVGLGPAVILGFEAYKNGQLVSGHSPVNGHDLAASFGLSDQATTKDDLRYGQVIPANERVTIFKISAWRKPMSAANFSDLFRKSSIEHNIVTCYRSIYPDRIFAAINAQTKIPESSCASPGFYARYPSLPDPTRIELTAPSH